MSGRERVYRLLQTTDGWQPLREAAYVCDPRNEPDPSQIGPAIAQLDSYISDVGSNEPDKLALALFLLSRVPPCFDRPDLVCRKEENTVPYFKLRPNGDVQMLLKKDEFAGLDEQKKERIESMFDLLSPDNAGRFYMDNVPNLLGTYVMLMNEKSDLGTKLRNEFANYLDRLFLLPTELKPRLEVGLILAFQEAVFRTEQQIGRYRLPWDFDLTSAYRDDHAEQWEKGLRSLGKRKKRGVWGDIISTHGVNPSLSTFTTHSSVYGRHEYPGGPNNFTRALLTGIDSSNGTLMSLGCGPWLLETESVFPEGDIVGVDKTDYCKKLMRAPWRKRTGVSRGDWEIMRVDEETMTRTRTLFEKGVIESKQGKVIFIKSNYARNPLPMTSNPVCCLLSHSAIWNTSRGETRIAGLRNIFRYKNFSPDAIVGITGAYFEPVRTINEIYLQRMGGRWQTLGLNTYGRQYQPGANYQESTRTVFFRDRLHKPQIQALEKIKSNVILIESSQLENLFELI